MLETAEPAPPADPPILVVPVSDSLLTVWLDEPESTTVPERVHKSVHSVFLSFDVPPERLNDNLIVPPALKK